MRTVELSQDECDVIANLLRGWNLPAADPNAVRLAQAAQTILRKITAPEGPEKKKE